MKIKTLVSLSYWQQFVESENNSLLRLAEVHSLTVYDDHHRFFVPVQEADGKWKLQLIPDSVE